MVSPAYVDIVRNMGIVGCARSIKICVNGAVVAKVSEGQTIRIQVPPFPCQVHARMSWWVSPAIDVNMPPGALLSLRLTYDFVRGMGSIGFWIPFIQAPVLALTPLGMLPPPSTPYPRVPPQLG